jgi:hypothetical protein
VTDVAAGSSETASSLGDYVLPVFQGLLPAATNSLGTVGTFLQGATAKVTGTPTPPGTLSTILSANGVLIAVGIILGLGALLISQRTPTANIIQAARSAVT